MSKPVVEPVFGDDRCPECKGNRVLPWTRDGLNHLQFKRRATLRELQNFYAGLMYADDGEPYIWCPVCGGSGTATDAMTRLLLGCTQFVGT